MATRTARTRTRRQAEHAVINYLSGAAWAARPNAGSNLHLVQAVACGDPHGTPNAFQMTMSDGHDYIVSVMQMPAREVE